MVSSRPHLTGEVARRWRSHVGGAGLLVDIRWEEGAEMIAALVQLGGPVAIFWSVGIDGHGPGLDPHHDRLAVKLPDLLSEVPVGLMTTCEETCGCQFTKHSSSNEISDRLHFTCCASASDVKVMNQLSLLTNSQLRNLGRSSPSKRASTSCTATGMLKLSEEEEEEEEWQAGTHLLRCAVGDLAQDDDTSTLTGTNLLSTWSHLDQRQGCQPMREENNQSDREKKGKKPLNLLFESPCSLKQNQY